MTIALYGLITFAVMFGGGMLGVLLGRILPKDYRDDTTQKIVQSATGMVSLLAALVLGLLVATAKNKFDTSNQQVEGFAASLMLLDRELTNYGPEANDTKALLRNYTIAKIAATWPQESGVKPGPNDPAWKLLESVQQSLVGLSPKTESQHLAVTAALQTAADLEKTTWLQTAQESNHVQHPFVIILVIWLFVLFVSFGLFAPRNAMVVAALMVGALAIAGAVVLVVDMDSPFEGMLVISPEPMKEALVKMNIPERVGAVYDDQAASVLQLTAKP
jgi:hypothetical protein